MIAALGIALGGAIGSLCRFWAGLAMARWNETLPWGTIIINIAGSFLIAFFGALTLAKAPARIPVGENFRLLAMVGFCGGFTTFSTFSAQSFELLRQGAIARALLNIILSVALCLTATAIGALTAEKIAGKPPKENIAELQKSDFKEFALRDNHENSDKA